MKVYCIVDSNKNQIGFHQWKHTAEIEASRLNRLSVNSAMKELYQLNGGLRGQGRQRFAEIVDEVNDGYYHVVAVQVN